ncbi:MAG: hypothetical protein PHX51_01190 [Clostridia bacterium]|nr:hypothetical protein [Clostridia bacterium]
MKRNRLIIIVVLLIVVALCGNISVVLADGNPVVRQDLSSMIISEGLAEDAVVIAYKGYLVAGVFIKGQLLSSGQANVKTIIEQLIKQNENGGKVLVLTGVKEFFALKKIESMINSGMSAEEIEEFIKRNFDFKKYLD